MIDCIELGPAPSDESCAQSTDPDFNTKNQEECQRYKEQLLNLAKAKNIPMGKAKLTIKSFSHDYGSYREVCVKFDTTDQVGIDFAFWLDENAPTTWENTSQVG